ncbi:MAG: 3-dehydroquinate synthase [Chitinophagaceae bacterium]|nr:3-dehydroquinate synthase [Chitinophagaceae bacterium]
MKPFNFKFSTTSVDYYFDVSFSQLNTLVDKKKTIVLTDRNVFEAHQEKFIGWELIVIEPGEEHKIQSTVDEVIRLMIEMEADRSTTLVGVGGGVITDLAGYIASVFMRGISFGFVPTTLLGMVDASVGGKNGIDVGVYKNMVGVIRQPKFLFYDYSFLATLPELVWSDGFAEIIKHACIKDAVAFKQLEKEDIDSIRNQSNVLGALVQRNVLLKTKVVQNDEFEKGERKLLNFGHTLGHAIETQYALTHGQAVAIGMSYALKLSEQITGFQDSEKVRTVIKQYRLPINGDFDVKKVLDILKMDKKRVDKNMNFILLEKIGKGIIQSIPMVQLTKMVQKIKFID